MPLYTCSTSKKSNEATLSHISVISKAFALFSKGVHGWDWCRLGQLRHQSITYGLMDLENHHQSEAVKNRSDPIRGGPDRIGLICLIR